MNFIFWDTTPFSPLKAILPTSMKQVAASFMLVSCLAYSSTLNMEAKYSFETSVDFQRTKWRYIPEDRNLHNHRSENLKPYKFTDVSEVRTAHFSTVEDYA
jgi:hypothetical protein